MDYKDIVQAIKDITGLEIEVKYNALRSPCFGIGEHAYEIMPEEDCIEAAMFDLYDFLENKHIDYYHIQLPKVIERKNTDFVFEYTKKQLSNYGIKIKNFTKELLEIFIILHEFGHAHHLFVEYNKNVEQYIKDTREVCDKNNYEMRFLGEENGFYKHKELFTEKYADNFALKHFVEICNILKIEL